MNDSATYEERRDELATKASVLVHVLLGAAPGDMEFMPTYPQASTQEAWQALIPEWGKRGLHSVGFIGLVDMEPRAVWSEPLDPREVAALAVAFGVYVGTLVTYAYKTQAEVSELERIYAYSGGPKYIH
jgi:hypothetical protein